MPNNRRNNEVEGVLRTPAETLLTVEGVFLTTGIGEDTLREWRLEKKLKGYKTGSRIRYLGSELMRCILNESVEA